MRNFEDMRHLLVQGSKLRMAVTNAADDHALHSALDVTRDGYVDPVLVGKGSDIRQMLVDFGEDPDAYQIVDVDSDEKAAFESVRLVRDGQADIILKGNIQTRDLLKAVVNSDTGIKNAEVLSHVALFEIPNYPKIVALTDGGMIVEPDFEAKKSIIKNALSVMNRLGYSNPKVAVLAAAEQVNPKSKASTEARALQDINRSGGLDGCVIDGPISLDLALDPETVVAKNYQGLIRGDADVLIAPDIVAGNLLGKSFSFVAGGRMAGVIVGASAPVVVTSRASTTAEKLYSIILALALAQQTTERQE